MTINFFPLGIPFSSSVAEKAKISLNTSPGGFPTSASLAAYISSYIGPTGPAYEIVSASGIL